MGPTSAAAIAPRPAKYSSFTRSLARSRKFLDLGLDHLDYKYKRETKYTAVQCSAI